MHRRDVLRGGALAGAALLSARAFAQSAAGAKIIPWLDQPAPIPPPATGVIKNLTPWSELGEWITPNDKFFAIGHYNWPTIDEKDWKLGVDGMVAKPATLTLAQLKALRRKEVVSTIECSGSNGLPFFTSGIGNAQWAGVPLADVLRDAQIKTGSLEVVFYGTDHGEEVVRPGTPGEFKFTANFARSMSIDDAMNPANLLCYEMNGAALPAANGFPLRLIAPGWYGIANVKWLNRIEVRDTRFLGRFMGRDYVTIREEQHDDKPILVETSVGRALLKSAPAQIVQRDGKYQIDGMAWGPGVTAVEVKIDSGPWTKATLDPSKSEFAWRFWHIEVSLTPGKHSVTSRAIDAAGKIQPAMDDPLIANKKTYWESNGQITRSLQIG